MSTPGAVAIRQRYASSWRFPASPSRQQGGRARRRCHALWRQCCGRQPRWHRHRSLQWRALREVNDRIVRYTLPAGSIVPTAPPEVIVSGLPLNGDHPMHPFVIDSQGNLYVDLGSATNSCQVKNRTLDSPGFIPARSSRRAPAPGATMRTGPAALLSGRALCYWDPQWRGLRIRRRWQIYVTQHGRDQLSENWPKLYRPEQGPNLPLKSCCAWSRAPTTAAGMLLRRVPGEAGAGSGYGGDGGKAVGPCAQSEADRCLPGSLGSQRSCFV